MSDVSPAIIEDAVAAYLTARDTDSADPIYASMKAALEAVADRITAPQYPTVDWQRGWYVDCESEGCMEKYGFLHFEHLQIEPISDSEIDRKRWSVMRTINGHAIHRVVRKVGYGEWKVVDDE